ncbi:hypothetical protein DPM19_15840 [Actinomadura craniellae]|uniref:NlpC/P60 domain-containing protein n=2 Tax=Actinomadura craniellae TaxID=2231787 RepID=A0A365H692_9ACTN|nr:hypothetical protein DPM19_15840 [Actinomadura craniellae]
MRTRGQTAADAAAIGALTPLRDKAILLAQNGNDPNGLGLWEAVTDIDTAGAAHTAAARQYADRNGSRLIGDVNVTGRLGYTMKATVATKDCQIKDRDKLTAQEAEDLRLRRMDKLCTDNTGELGVPRSRGGGSAIAQLQLPECVVEYSPPDPSGNRHPIALHCGGVTVWRPGGALVSRGRLMNLFKIRLVAKEDSTEYNGLPPTEYFGGVGWDGVIPGNPCEIVKRIIQNARNKIGKAYVWGGESEAEGGYDCSGLIYASYLEAGISIPRTTFTQWPYGVRVTGPEKPGDLVFFNSGPGTASGRPGHVGLVVDPERKLMIEAACTACGPIRVSSYARSNMVGFTRPLAHATNKCPEE